VNIKALYNYLYNSRHVASIWLVGIVLFLYLSIPFFNKDSGMYFLDIIVPSKLNPLPNKKVSELQKDNSANEALLFVTINKKQFLTKFVTYISDEDLAANKVKDTADGKANNSFIIVGRKANKKPSKTKEDFFIRAAPKI